jgi:1-acyl-sn-glycerol-3-phosphate acyltransferase
MAEAALARLNHAWRVLATGISFAAFGVGGLLLGGVVLPLLFLIRSPLRRRAIARRLVQRSFAAHIGLMHRLGVLTYEIIGRERLQRRGLLVLANHPTLIDVVFLVSLLPNADCIVKRAVATSPFMRGPVRAAGYISNDDGAGLVDDCVGAVRDGGTLVIFPEGTRSVPGQPAKLQRGAANIAVRGRFDITPVHISCCPATLGKGQKWYLVPSRRFHVRVEIGQDIPIAPFLDETGTSKGEALAARRVTDHLTRYFDFLESPKPCKHLSTRSRN